MATTLQVALAEYMETSYRPDREYIDGEVVERNMGKYEHGRLQALLAGLLTSSYEESAGVQTVIEWRVQVSPTRVRIPDLVLVPDGLQPPVLVEPPLLVIEILSPGETYSDTQRRASDYLQMGARTIWIIDPETRTARQCVDDVWTATGFLEVPGTPIRVDLAALFGRLNPA